MILDKTLAQLKLIGLSLLYIAIVIIFIYIISYIIIRRKKNKDLEDIQQEILREGRVNAKNFKLRYLFTSNNYSNPINEGKIISYVIGENDGDKYSVFAVRNGIMSQTKFYKVPLGEHTDLIRDVTLREWNFAFDSRKLFYVKNTNIVDNKSTYDDKEQYKVDTIANLSPLVGKAILGNYIHRIRVRERKLIKLPEDEMRQQ